jgi:hypothetical protein
MPRLVRTNSWSPTSSSSALIRAVNVGCVKYISSAARLTFPNRATARKHSICLKSISSSGINFFYHDDSSKQLD